MCSRSSSVTISSVSSSWLRRKRPHWQLSGISGVCRTISVIGWRSSCCSAMNMRGMSGKLNAMWHSSPFAEIRPQVGRPLVRLGDQHAIGVALVHRAPDLAQDPVRLLEALAGRALPLDQVGHRVEAHAVDAAIEPEPHRPDHRLQHARVVEVEIRLVVEEAMPVVGLRGVVPLPVRRLGIDEDDADALVLLVRVAPDVEVALRRSGRRAPRRLEPGMLIRGVVDDELGDDPDAALVRLGDEPIDVATVP